MAGKSNAIGSGALVLTVNADKMLAGIDKAGNAAAAKAKSVSSKVDASGGGKKGGLFGRLLGGVAGGIAGAAIFAALVKGPELAMRAFAELEKRASGADKGAQFIDIASTRSTIFLEGTSEAYSVIRT